MDTIKALRLVVDAKDIYPRGHSDRVSYYCEKMGEKFDLSISSFISRESIFN